LEGKVYIGISIELDAAGAKHESSDGRADAEQDCGCQAGDFKRSFLTSVKVVITLIPPVLLGSKARNPMLR
jgi:hypothetical protein